MSPSPVIAEANAAWSPASWRERTAAQQPKYPDQAALSETLGAVARTAPARNVVGNSGAQATNRRSGAGTAFYFAGRRMRGAFQRMQRSHYRQSPEGAPADEPCADLRIRTPVVRIGRFAGQHAKPRSADSETRDGVPFRATGATWSTAPPSRPKRAGRTRSACCRPTRIPP